MLHRIGKARSFAALFVVLCPLLVWLNRPLKASNVIICAVPSAAHPMIQSALDDAACEAIEIAAGVFYEHLAIDRPVEIIGAGASETVVDGFASGSVITIDSATVKLRRMGFTNGSAQLGGGIYAQNANLRVEECRIYGNYASWNGGGLFAESGELILIDSTVNTNRGDTGGGLYIDAGNVELVDSRIGANEANHHAGGLFIDDESEGFIVRTTFANNIAYVDGGGLFNHGTMTINSSSLHENRSTNYSGGAIRNEGTLYVNNSTISSNSDGFLDGGGISSCSGALRLSNVTITANSGSPALFDCGSDIRMKNSILSGNPGKDCSGTIRSDGYNMVYDVSGCDYRLGPGDIIGRQALLGPLQGSPAFHLLLPGPGVNGGNPGGCRDHLGQLLEVDQRGLPRVQRCDMGATENQGGLYQAFLPLSQHNYCSDFVDDFSSPDSGWSIIDDDYVYAGYYQGEYLVRTKRSGYLYAFRSPACGRDNYTLQVDARWVGEAGLAYGLSFDVQGDFEEYYLFVVNTDNRVFWVDYVGPAGIEPVADPIQTGAIHADETANTLRVDRIGSRIKLTINGIVVRDIGDSRIVGLGGAGVFTVPYSDEGDTEARFDNFASRSLFTRQGQDRPISGSLLFRKLPTSELRMDALRR